MNTRMNAVEQGATLDLVAEPVNLMPTTTTDIEPVGHPPFPILINTHMQEDRPRHEWGSSVLCPPYPSMARPIHPRSIALEEGRGPWSYINK